MLFFVKNKVFEIVGWCGFITALSGLYFLESDYWDAVSLDFEYTLLFLGSFAMSIPTFRRKAYPAGLFMAVLGIYFLWRVYILFLERDFV